MANKQINELTEKTDVLHDDDLILVYDSEEVGSEKTKKVAISNYVASINEATTLYVDPAGNDTTGDGTSGNPWATPNQAYSWLRNKFIHNYSGYINIQLNDGTYNSLDSIWTSHPQGDRITLKGNTTTPSNVVLNFNSGHAGIRSYRGVYHQLEGLKLVGNNKAVNEYGLYSTYGSHISAYKCEMHNWWIGAHGFHGGNMDLNNCVINDNVYGIQVQNSRISVYGSSSVTNNDTVGIRAIWNGSIISAGSTFSGNGQNSETTSGGVVTII